MPDDHADAALITTIRYGAPRRYDAACRDDAGAATPCRCAAVTPEPRCCACLLRAGLAPFAASFSL